MVERGEGEREGEGEGEDAVRSDRGVAVTSLPLPTAPHSSRVERERRGYSISHTHTTNILGMPIS